MRTPGAASRPIHETEVQFYTIRPYKTNSFRLEVFSLVLDCEALDELSGWRKNFLCLAHKGIPILC